VFETKNYIEMDCLHLALQKADNQEISKFKDLVIITEHLSDDEFFQRMMELSDNHLFLRLWSILKEYYHSLEKNHLTYEREYYLNLVNALAEKDLEKTLSAYKKLRNLSNSLDKY
jgi:GntR family transcriptional repressor for pyruvate dehydrogenase complex